MKDEGKRKIEELVERFSRNIDVYKSGSYNEAQTRREFIEPFFEALGWDVYNRQGYAEQYKDVVHEDSVKVGVSLKAPDYSFRIGGQRKFFLEAKKPYVSIKDDIDPAYQLRRYAWSAKLPLSILTDFEELAVYDCRIKPSPRDKVGTGRIAYYTYKRYIDEFDAVYDVFSRDAVLKGSFDRYAVTTAGKRGTAEVDREFLKEIEGWRDSLARSIAIRNSKLTVDEMNFAVQQTIDRLIFLRICEDRGIEQYGSLQALLNGVNTYRRLFELFYQADTKYNSGLFDFSADKLTPDIKIDDDVLKGIIDSLYYPKSPYEFSVLGVDILGNVYEQFLGKVIRLTAGHNAKVEEKPEVKKAGGVYYTPEYIVEYIVQNTVGKLIEGKTPKKAEELKILDPACGSGSFLIGAYQHLLNYHLKWYIENSPDKYAKGKFPAVYRSGEGWRLTTQEKKRILLNNIFGVDIDRQAVEVTKLSLLLKVLEDENRETIGKNLLLFRERVLPNLDDNIKCGNSLIGTDFYSSTLPLLPFHQGRGKAPSPLAGEGWGEGDDLNRKLNPFDWHDPERGFGKIIPPLHSPLKKGGNKGGFDAVIGNPPWGADFTTKEKTYLMAKFENIHMRTPDSFNYFLGRGMNLLRNIGLIGMIIPNNFLFQHEYAKSREYFVKNFWLLQAINLGDSVFDVTAPSCIIVMAKNNPKTLKVTNIIDLRRTERETLPKHIGNIVFEQLDNNDILTSPDAIIPMDKKASKLISRIITDYPALLDSLCSEVAAGIGTGGDKVFRIEDKVAKKLSIESNILHPVLIGRDINSYYIPENSGFSIIYSTKVTSAKSHPHTLSYLKPFQAKLSQKRETKKGLIPWWSLHWPRYSALFDPPKIILRQTADSLYASIDKKGYYCLNSIIIIRPKDEKIIHYLIGLLNSKLLRWIYKNITQESDRIFAEVKPINLRKLPIRTIDFNNKKEKAMHYQIVSMVEKMLDLHEKLKKAKTPHDRELIERQIKATDSQIDRLVYELYGLTEEEIKVVEGGNDFSRYQFQF